MAQPKVNSALVEILANDAATLTNAKINPDAYHNGEKYAAAWNKSYFQTLDQLKYENGLWPEGVPYPKPDKWGDIWGTML